MTPKEKAEELVGKYLDLTPVDYKLTDSVEDVNNKALADLKLCKQCALIAVDEILDVLNYINYCPTYVEDIKYWEQTKQEIEKL